MKSWVGAVALAGLVLLPACTSSGASTEQVTETRTPSASGRDLPAQSLNKGECGLFLWSVSGDPAFIFFSQAGSQEARAMIAGAEHPLDFVGANGDVFGQFQVDQRWASPETGHMVDLSVQPGENVVAGQTVTSGRMKLTDSAGWETIIPVAGMVGCQEDVAGGPDSAP